VCRLLACSVQASSLQSADLRKQGLSFAGGTPVFIPSGPETGHKVTPEALSAHLSANSRLLILNSPNNPSGAVYSAAELEAIGQLCIKHDIWVISDEVYSAFTYTPGGHVSIASFAGMRERTVVTNAVSKTYGMTGWRIGYAAAPAVLAEAMVRLQSHTTGNPNSIAQYAAIAALSGPHDWFDPIRKDYETRRRRIVDGVRAIRGLTCGEPQGAFFLWVDASYWTGRTVAGRTITDADDLAAVLLEEGRVVIMPGTGFGDSRYLRLSFAASRTELEDALDAMARLLGRVDS